MANAAIAQSITNTNTTASLNALAGNTDPTAGDALCSTLLVRCDAASAYPLKVRIPGLHSATEFCPIAIGEKEYFCIPGRGIKELYLQGNGGTATASWSAVSIAKTP